MKTYYFARNSEVEAFAVFEAHDGLLKSIRPHTPDSANYVELEALIKANDPSIVFCDIAVAQALPWAPSEPLTPEQVRNEVRTKRAAEYPPMADYIDGIVKGDQAQVQAYINACLAVKAKYPKPQE